MPNTGLKKEVDFGAIEILVLDVDGVLTDGTVSIHSDGSESKGFSIIDGHGIKLWHRSGLKTALLSGRASGATDVRAAQLEITNIVQGAKKKLPAFEQLLGELGLETHQAVYVGDDLLDIPPVRRAGLGVAVANAVDELKEQADYVTLRQGGSGAVREVIELVLKSTGRWDALMERYLV